MSHSPVPHAPPHHPDSSDGEYTERGSSRKHKKGKKKKKHVSRSISREASVEPPKIAERELEETKKKHNKSPRKGEKPKDWSESEEGELSEGELETKRRQLLAELEDSN